MIISPETLETLNSMYTVQFYNNSTYECSPEEATEIYIGNEKLNGSVVDENGFFINSIYKTIKVPKKEITIDWIVNRINSVSIFKNFTEYFNEIVKKY
jgi:hypothetical protein